MQQYNQICLPWSKDVEYGSSLSAVYLEADYNMLLREDLLAVVVFGLHGVVTQDILAVLEHAELCKDKMKMEMFYKPVYHGVKPPRY